MQRLELDPWLIDPRRRPLVMGVLNITPDSFSDGGKFTTVAQAAEYAVGLAAAGADLIDVGGESTRPGALPVPGQEQIRRIVPAIAAIRQESPIILSVDTRLWDVAAAALAAGADLVNDISAGRDDARMFPGVAAAKTPIILMHMLESPATMQINPTYPDVTAGVVSFLRDRLAAAEEAGIDPARVLLDPGIGFGKTVEHSLTLLHEVSALAAIGRPLVVGTSRKSFIGKVLNEPDPLRRGFGDAAAISWAVANGAAVVRVHDVGPMGQVVKMVRAIMERRGPAY